MADTPESQRYRLLTDIKDKFEKCQELQSRAGSGITESTLQTRERLHELHLEEKNILIRNLESSVEELQQLLLAKDKKKEKRGPGRPATPKPKESIKLLSNQVSALQKDLKSAQQRILDLEQKNVELAISSSKPEEQLLETSFDKDCVLGRENTVLNIQQRVLAADNEKLRDDLQEMKQRYQASLLKSERLQSQLEFQCELIDTLKSLQQNIIEVLDQQDNVLIKTDCTTMIVESQFNDAESLQKENSHICKKILCLAQEKTRLESENNAAKSELIMLTDKSTKFGQENQKLSDKVRQLSEEVVSLTTENEDINSRLKLQIDENARLVNVHSQKQKELMSKVESLQSEKDSVSKTLKGLGLILEKEQIDHSKKEQLWKQEIAEVSKRETVLQSQVSHLAEKLAEQLSKNTELNKVLEETTREWQQQKAQLEKEEAELEEQKQLFNRLTEAAQNVLQDRVMLEELVCNATTQLGAIRNKEAEIKQREQELIQSQQNLLLSEELADHNRRSGMSVVEKSQAVQLLSTLSMLKADLNSLRGNCSMFFQKTQQMIMTTIAAAEQHNKELVRKYKKEMGLRKKYHNQLVEIRGNIRVFARIRPVIDEDMYVDDIKQVVDIDGDDESIVRVFHKGRESSFELDRAFGPDSTQAEVFHELEPLILNCLDGFNICIFAYGQTGAGKTYTMEGSEENPGVNQRALDKLFTEIADRMQDSWKYRISLSAMEIYNEKIRDLLGDGDKLDVKMLPDGSLHVPGLTWKNVYSSDDVNVVFNIARCNRATAATNMNERSSRSHALLCIKVSGVNTTTGVFSSGKLNLIDLAGSERLSKSGSGGERLKEAQNINKSLSALGDVIQALKTKQAHVPYRNSKLTYLLQDSLGGSSKVMMLVQVAPANYHVNETMCSLGFAKRVNGVELGQAVPVKGADEFKENSPLVLVADSSPLRTLQQKTTPVSRNIAHLLSPKTLRRQMSVPRFNRMKH